MRYKGNENGVNYRGRNNYRAKFNPGKENVKLEPFEVNVSSQYSMLKEHIDKGKQEGLIRSENRVWYSYLKLSSNSTHHSREQALERTIEKIGRGDYSTLPKRKQKRKYVSNITPSFTYDDA